MQVSSFADPAQAGKLRQALYLSFLIDRIPAAFQLFLKLCGIGRIKFFLLSLKSGIHCRFQLIRKFF